MVTAINSLKAGEFQFIIFICLIHSSSLLWEQAYEFCLCYHLYLWEVADFQDILYEYYATGDHSPRRKFYVFSHPCGASIKVGVLSQPLACRPTYITTWNLCNGRHEILYWEILWKTVESVQFWLKYHEKSLQFITKVCEFLRVSPCAHVYT
jgi:hypothetical protein